MFLTVKLYPLPQVPSPLRTHFLQRPPESLLHKELRLAGGVLSLLGGIFALCLTAE